MAVVSKIDLGKESLVWMATVDWPRAATSNDGPGANTIQYNHDHRNSSRVKAIADPETYRSSDVLRFGSDYDTMVAWLVAVTVYRESYLLHLYRPPHCASSIVFLFLSTLHHFTSPCVLFPLFPA